MNAINDEQLKTIVKSVIPKENPYWILLSNGTFLVLEANESPIKDLKKWAMELLEELYSLQLRVFAYVDEIITVKDFGGWIVTNRYGAYTYVHPSEFPEQEPSELAISVKGCYKFMDDCQEKEILYINFPRPSGSKQA